MPSPTSAAATFSDSDLTAMDNAAQRLWQGEANNITNAKWDTYLHKQQGLNNSKAGHDSYVVARDKIKNFAYPPNKLSGSGNTSIPQATSAIKALHYSALRSVLLTVTNPVHRAALFAPIGANIDVGATADPSSFLAALPETTDPDFENKINNEISDVTQAAGYFDDIGGGKLPVAVIKAIGRYQATKNLPIEMRGPGGSPPLTRNEILKLFGEKYELPGLEKAAKIFGYVLVAAQFALGIWHAIEQATDYAQNCIKTIADAGLGLLLVAVVGDGIETAVEAAKDAIIVFLEIAGSAAADAASVVAGIVTFGIGTVVGIALTALLDAIVDLFWVSSGNPYPANMKVLMTAPMTASIRSGLLAPMTASMTASMTTS